MDPFSFCYLKKRERHIHPWALDVWNIDGDSTDVFGPLHDLTG
jgi:hypothetical protein